MTNIANREKYLVHFHTPYGGSASGSIYVCNVKFERLLSIKFGSKATLMLCTCRHALYADLLFSIHVAW